MSVKIGTTPRILVPGNLKLTPASSVGFSNWSFQAANGPSTVTAYNAQPLIYGVSFGVNQGGIWFYGYRFWCAPTVQGTTGYKFALWQVTGSGGAGTIVPNSVVSGVTVVPGQWNYVPVATPLLLSPAATPGTAPTYGCIYHACVGNPTDWVGGFPELKAQYGAGPDPFPNGITSGPALMYSSLSGNFPPGGTAVAPGGQWQPQMAYTTGAADPALAMPSQNDTDANLYMDVVLSNQPIATPQWSMVPNMPVFNVPGVGAQSSAYTLGTPFIASSGKLYGIRHYSPPGVTVLPTRCGLWNKNTGLEVTGTDNSAPTWSGAAGSGWVTCTYAGVTIPLGVTLIASTFTADNTDAWFLAQTGWYNSAFPAGIVQGNVTFPGPSYYNLGITWTFPATPNTEYDGVDVIIQ